MIIKQSVVDVLMFLFEQYLGDDNTVLNERDDMHNRLEEMGFEHREITQAFDWLEDLTQLQGAAEISTPCQGNSMRIFSEEEKILLNEDCRGFLIYLEQTGILTPVTREVVLDRVFALDQELDIEQLKWIAMIILHTHPGEENAFAWMESLVFDEIVDYMQ
jgi:Smg protein